jgi:hypothetical protein
VNEDAAAPNLYRLGEASPGHPAPRDDVGDAIREGLRTEAAPMARRVNEIRGLSNQLLRRLERIETDLTAERDARVDDLALLVDLIASSWRNVELRLARIERALAGRPAA